MIDGRLLYKTILVCSAQSVVVEVLCEQLGDLGCFVAGPFPGSLDCLEWLDHSSADLALLDQQLSGFDATLLRERFVDEQVPFLAFRAGKLESGETFIEWAGAPFPEIGLANVLHWASEERHAGVRCSVLEAA